MVRSPSAGRRADVADFHTSDAELEETLESLDEAANYAGWIFDLVEPNLGENVVEIGAGHGTFTEALARSADRVVATDISARCVELLRQRFSDEPRVEILQGSVDAAASFGPFDSAVLINVLEHIQEDGEALDAVFRLLKPGGRLALWVPAFDLLYSRFDSRIGHCRRYRKEGLRMRLIECGFEVADIRYVNTVGAIGWFVVARLLRLTPTTGALAKVFDKYFVPVLQRIENKHRPPFGQSVFAVAVRPRG